MELIHLPRHVKNITTLEIETTEHSKFDQIVTFMGLKFIVNSLMNMVSLY